MHMYTKYEFICLTLCQGEVCTDKDDDRQFMIVQGSLVDKPNETNVVFGMLVPYIYIDLYFLNRMVFLSSFDFFWFFYFFIFKCL